MQRTHWFTILRAVVVLAVLLVVLAVPGSGQPFQPQAGASAAGAPAAGWLWWLLLAVPLIAHGLAHLSGLAAPFTRRDLGFAERPWLFAHGVTLHSTIGRAFGLAWLAASLALVGAGLGLLFGQPWWASLALAAASLSLALIIIWWQAAPPGAKVGAAFDVLILLAALQAVQAPIGLGAV